MKCKPNTLSTSSHLLALALTACLALPLPSLAASVALATSPLATSTTSTVLPNVMFILDDSGSMGWNYMPDDANDFDGKYGFPSSQCNGVYYDPNITYTAPVYADGTNYANASFTAAWTNGYNTGAGTTNLSTGFRPTSSYTAGSAFYYAYSGTQASSDKKDYYNHSSIFYRECNSSIGSTTAIDGTNPVNTVYTKRRLNNVETTTITVGGTGGTSGTTFATVTGITVNGAQIMSAASATASGISSSTMATNISNKINLCTAAISGNCTVAGYSATVSGSIVTITGPTSAANYTPVISTTGSMGSMTFTTDVFPDTTAAKLTNFANWYSYYRTRMLMMKTSSGLAFKSLDQHYRVGFMTINDNVSPDILNITTFDTTQKSDWYGKLYAATPNNSTPLREALSNAGKIYAHKLTSLYSLTLTDPVQYSCQQNFTILSTDGFWNGNAGSKLAGGAIGNQDGLAPRAKYDGAFINVTSSQVRETKTQVSQATSQVQKRTQQIQSSTSNLQRQVSQLQQQDSQLQSSTSNLQSSTMYLQSRSSSDSGSSWGTGWSNASSCTWDNNGSSRTQCRYVTASGGSTVWTASAATWTNSGSCTRSFGTGTSGTWTGNGTSCQYSAYSAWSNVASCTAVAQDTTSPHTVGTATQCQYTAWSAAIGVPTCTAVAQDTSSPYTVGTARQCTTVITSPYANVTSCTSSTIPDGSGNTTQCQYTAYGAWANASSCTPVAQSTSSPYAGPATLCQTTDTGFVGASSCTPSGPTAGQTVTCNTVTTGGPTNYVASCTPATAAAGNSWTTTTCTTTTLQSATLVASCTAAAASASNSYVTTTCTPTSTTLSNQSSCTAESPSAGNNWTSVTCTATGGTSDTLADVAMYYYQTDLRDTTLSNCIGAAGVDVCNNNVFKTDTDTNTAQHMATFTLGLGASGRMKYSPSYLSDTSGDYYSVLKGLTADSSATPPRCSWQTNGTACNWPVPGDNQIENIDDLWHAAVDGQGIYFSATNPSSLSSGLTNALAAISARKGAGAAAATSTMNPVPGNNFAYVASYTTVKWQGNLEARTVDPTTLRMNKSAYWCVENIVPDTCAAPATVVADASVTPTAYSCVTAGSTDATCSTPGVFDAATSECRVPMASTCIGTMPARVAANSDTRTIYTRNGNALTSFDAAYATANPTNFEAAHINALSQWTSLTATQKTAAEGVNLINFLRGQTDHEDRAINLGAQDNRLFRYREATLGDALESQPVFIANPVFPYVDPGYTEFAAAQASRHGTVFIGTNDGMLHAFSTLAEGSVPGGSERWAYVPSMVIPNMWKLADKDYSARHTNFINGSPIVSDVCTADCGDSTLAVWRTILVGGLNAGGRGYYALDITNPASPSLLWEFTTAEDSDLGYTYGNPVITAKSDGTWVVLVTSGYNNTSPGNGQGYLYVLDAGTGAIISKIGNGAGSTTTPSGLAKIAGWNDSPSSNRATYVYGGDLLGNVWRFDINTPTAAPLLFATLNDPSGNRQPITTAPVLGQINFKRVVFVATGKYLETSDLTDTRVQSVYAIKDDNATATLTNPAGSPRNSLTLVQQTITPIAGTSQRTSTKNTVNFRTGRGWYSDFPDTGERSNIESRLVQGTLVVATIVPSNTVCAPGGYSWLNFFNYLTGGPVDTIVSERYDNPIVGINYFVNGDGTSISIVDSSGNNLLDNNIIAPPPPPKFNSNRILWRELNP
jgi:type IV pilus assembly protein PilY1